MVCTRHNYVLRNGLGSCLIDEIDVNSATRLVQNWNSCLAHFNSSFNCKIMLRCRCDQAHFHVCFSKVVAVDTSAIQTFAKKLKNCLHQLLHIVTFEGCLNCALQMYSLLLLFQKFLRFFNRQYNFAIIAIDFQFQLPRYRVLALCRTTPYSV